MTEEFFEIVQRDNETIRHHIEEIRSRLRAIQELDGTWHLESEGTIEKFDGTRMPRRTGIRFDGLMHHLDTIWDDEV